MRKKIYIKNYSQWKRNTKQGNQQLQWNSN